MYMTLMVQISIQPLPSAASMRRGRLKESILPGAKKNKKLGCWNAGNIWKWWRKCYQSDILESLESTCLRGKWCEPLDWLRNSGILCWQSHFKLGSIWVHWQSLRYPMKDRTVAFDCFGGCNSAGNSRMFIRRNIHLWCLMPINTNYLHPWIQTGANTFGLFDKAKRIIKK